MGLFLVDLRENVYNAMIQFLVRRTHLHCTTIWAMFQAIDSRMTPRELEHYIKEYERGKKEGIKF